MQSLVKTALVGVNKHPAIVLDACDDLQLLLSTMPGEDKAASLLYQAGAWALFQMAGQQPATHVAALSCAPTEARGLRSPRLIQLLTDVIRSQQTDLLGEFLIAMKQAAVELPFEILPLVLDVTDNQVRTHLIPVLGSRGLWLSRLNPRWEWVSQGIASITGEDRQALQRAWEEGKLSQRALALSVIRRADPAEGRRWLEATLPVEKADARTALVEQLQHGLSDEDEPVLEALLSDRSDQVRQLAVSLLRQIVKSRYVSRMMARASTVITRRAGKLVASPPEELPGDWQQDGISAKVPGGRGKRGYWLESLVSAVPLAQWVSLFEMQPERLMTELKDDPCLHDLVLGWTRAIEQERLDSSSRLAWAYALWNYWLIRWQHDKKKNQDVLNKLAVLLRLLPQGTAEKSVLPFLVLGRLDLNALTLLLDVLPRPWSGGFSAHYLQLARDMVSSGMIDQAYEWSKSLDIAARALPRSMLALASAPWPEIRQEKKSWTANALAQQLDRFSAIVKCRQVFYEELPAKSCNR